MKWIGFLAAMNGMDHRQIGFFKEDLIELLMAATITKVDENNRIQLITNQLSVNITRNKHQIDACKK